MCTCVFAGGPGYFASSLLLRIGFVYTGIEGERRPNFPNKFNLGEMI